MESNSAGRDHGAAMASSAVTETPPLQKRRRPALSCIPCRLRKLKCDRRMPCSRCVKSSNAVCSYEEQHSRSHAHASIANILPNYSSAALPSYQEHGTSVSREPIDSRFPFVPGVSASNVRSIPPGVSYEAFFPPLEHRRPRHQHQDSESIAGAPTPISEESVQELRDRIRQLEGKLESLNFDRGPPEDSSDQANTGILNSGGFIHDNHFFGSSHWLNVRKQFKLVHFSNNFEKHDSSEVSNGLRRCKCVARAIKAQRPIPSNDLSDLRSYVPSRATSDQLVHLYFRVFESTYRILHCPVFFREYEQYWSNPAASSTSFVVKLLLVMAIAAVPYEDGNGGSRLRCLASQWIRSSQIWLSAPYEKDRVNMTTLEIQCLLILARQIHSIGLEILWVSAGAVLHTSMTMGLHRDPSNFPNLTVFQAESRKRLWATVIEIVTQLSLDCGMSPTVSFDDYDCEPPSNYDDTDFDEQTEDLPPQKVDSIFTDSSIQITLLQSLRTRVEICKLINDFRSKPPYEKVLALSDELTKHIRSHSHLFHPSPSSQSRFTTTHQNVLDLMTRRFLLALHFPFAIQARTNPSFHFSRKSALDASMIIITYAETGPAAADHFTRMKLVSGSCFRDSTSLAALALILELVSQISEDSSARVIIPGPSAGRAARQPLHDALASAASIAKRRLAHGETNVKCYLFLGMVQAQISAMEMGCDVVDAVAMRGRQVTDEAYGLLRAQVSHTPDASPSPEPLGEGIDKPFGDGTFEWDALMQDIAVDFDLVNTRLYDGWDNP